MSEQLSILIYDNSPVTQQINTNVLPFSTIEYCHDPQNGGLSAAYNYALEAARRTNIEWLLLLDQDTDVAPGFFVSLLDRVSAPPEADVCAIVPKLVQDSKVLSPQLVGRFRNQSIAVQFSGICFKPLTALNSAACLKVQSVVDIGGFPREYWLDYLDHIMFHRLQATGGRVMVLNVVIEHHLSLMNLAAEMSVERYANVLRAEWMFIRETGWGGGSLVHRIRLLKRALRYSADFGSRSYALQALRSAFA